MLPTAIIFLGWLVIYSLSNMMAVWQQVEQGYMTDNAYYQTSKQAIMLDGYFARYGQFPATWSALTSDNEFQGDARLFNSPWNRYVVTSTDLQDSLWRYRRAGLFTAIPNEYQYVYNGMNATDITNYNACGSTVPGTFFTDNNGWCGPRGGRWWKAESRASYMERIQAQRLIHNRLASKVVAYYNANGSLPASATAIKDSAGAASVTSTTCVGPYNWNGIVADCEDLFGLTGGQATNFYQINTTTFAIQTPMNILRADGTPLFVTTFLDIRAS